MSLPALTAFVFCVLLLALALRRAEDGFLPIVDHANLAFHEAGHPLFGLLGEWAGLYGGTLAQLLMPLLVAAAFALRRDALGTAAAGVWVCENLFNIAVYVADAREQSLPLVGGGEHDWALILGGWGLLAWDQRLAGLLRFAGAVGLVGCCAWLAWRAWFDSATR